MAEYVVEFGKDGRPAEPDGRLDAAAFHRNHEAIWTALAPFLAGKSGDVVETGSGTGQHVVDFARRSPEITWWPSDLNERHLKSIAAWRAHAGLANVRPPLRIDLSDPAWGPELHEGSGPGKLLGVFCANVIHIAPWRVAEGLFAGAGGICGPMDDCSCMARSSGTASTLRPAMQHSTPACAKEIPNGAYATSPIWRSSRTPPVWRWPGVRRCLPTI